MRHLSAQPLQHLIMSPSKTFLAFLMAGVCCLKAADAAAPLSEESSVQRDARLQWFREAKFGMFIHWGVYSVPAGFYQGQPIKGIGEWIMLRGKIPVSAYRAFAKDFNPVKYRPDDWASLAAKAGMKYMVITSKHHDGFALFPSDATDWDVADATPFKKDLIGPLAAAARKKGLKFGLYYSQAQDWTHPGGAKSGYKEGDSWDNASKGSFDAYLAKVAVPQVQEILSRYRPDILWWDTPTWMNAERATPLNKLLALRPGIITNNRLGGGFKGDTETPEQYVPATGYPGRDWEVCMTMNDTWGFKSDDQNWKGTDVLIRNLVDIVSKGGNYLLNIGPMSTGEIPKESIERLEAIGAWMKVNAQSIYGTTASPFPKLKWGRCTKKVTSSGTTLYLHVFDWPADGRLTIPGLTTPISKARVLATGASVSSKRVGDSTELALPASAPDAISSTLVLELKGDLKVERIYPKVGSSGGLLVELDEVDIHNSLRAHARLEGKGSNLKIGRWNHPQSSLSFEFLAAAGHYAVKAQIAGKSGGTLRVQLGDSSFKVKMPASATGEARWVELGVFDVKQGDIVQKLLLAPEGKEEKDWPQTDLLKLEIRRD